MPYRSFCPKMETLKGDMEMSNATAAKKDSLIGLIVLAVIVALVAWGIFASNKKVNNLKARLAKIESRLAIQEVVTEGLAKQQLEKKAKLEKKTEAKKSDRKPEAKKEEPKKEEPKAEAKPVQEVKEQPVVVEVKPAAPAKKKIKITPRPF